MVGWGGDPCDFSVSKSPFGLDFGTLDFGTSDSGLTIKNNKIRGTGSFSENKICPLSAVNGWGLIIDNGW